MVRNLTLRRLPTILSTYWCGFTENAPTPPILYVSRMPWSVFCEYIAQTQPRQRRSKRFLELCPHRLMHHGKLCAGGSPLASHSPPSSQNEIWGHAIFSFFFFASVILKHKHGTYLYSAGQDSVLLGSFLALYKGIFPPRCFSSAGGILA